MTAGTQQPCWPSLSGAHEAMLMEDTSSVMDWLSPVPLGLRNGRQGDSGRVARHSTFTYHILTQLPACTWYARTQHSNTKLRPEYETIRYPKAGMVTHP